MNALRVCLALVALGVVVGCTARQEKTSAAPKAPVRIAQSAEGTSSANAQQVVELPPPGQPLVGEKPPMPEIVNVANPPGVSVESIASGLDVPWDIAFPSANKMYVTERSGTVRVLVNRKLRPQPYARIARVATVGEGGLMGMALDRDYSRNRRVYLMYTYESGGARFNRVSRFTDTGTTFTGEKVLIQDIRGATYHDGGALRFGPDGMLYVGTGDAGNPESAQNTGSLSGKILRMTTEGKRPGDNPFPNSLVWAYGFRNVQGLAWNPANGDLWATNHGPSGEFGLEAMDSIFKVTKGGNHGWPRSLGVTGVKGVTAPVLWFPGSSVPPALAMFYKGSKIPGLNGDFFFASLRGEHLCRVRLSGGGIGRIERWFATGTHEGKYGRLRAVAQGPDGAIYVTTSNRDRRAQTRSGDDHILRIAAR